jgi:hypothetical protein
MKVVVEKLPKGSDALKIAYNSAVERIDAQKSGLKELANQVLSWIIISRCPFRTEEPQHAPNDALGMHRKCRPNQGILIPAFMHRIFRKSA